MVDMISYDKNQFIYKETTKEIIDDFTIGFKNELSSL